MEYDTTVVTGAQFGDEGKGKIVDSLSQNADMVVRYNGAGNAGHTIVRNNQTFKLHTVPSGILNPKTTCVIGNGVLVDLTSLNQELENLEKNGINTKNFYICENAHVIFPYHKFLDELQEQNRGPRSIGTTKKGIGPATVDMVSRHGIRLSDIKQNDIFIHKINTIRRSYEENIKNPPFSWTEMIKSTHEQFNKIKHRLADTPLLINEYIENKKNVIFEGAQGSQLNLHSSDYPYVTSSYPTAGGACTGSGVGPTKIKAVIGVTKAYATRVGNGPFVTELHDETGKKLLDIGKEYGTTTGRQRRCGWLDLVALKRACLINGFTSLAVTKIDVLNDFEEIKACVGYEIDGEQTDIYPNQLFNLERAKPIYISFRGWQSKITKDDVPNNANIFLTFIEKYTNTKISMLSFGSDREDTIVY